jgi:hypothetical protein
MVLKATTKKGRWEELVSLSSYELLNYLYGLGDESDALTMDSEHTDILAHVVNHHHAEFKAYLEEHIKTKGGTDFRADS